MQDAEDSDKAAGVWDTREIQAEVQAEVRAEAEEAAEQAAEEEQCDSSSDEEQAKAKSREVQAGRAAYGPKSEFAGVGPVLGVDLPESAGAVSDEQMLLARLGHRAASSAEISTLATPAALADSLVGESVVLTGLKGRADLNGEAGTLLKWVEATQRWAVRVRAETPREEKILVRPANIQ